MTRSFYLLFMHIAKISPCEKLYQLAGWLFIEAQSPFPSSFVHEIRLQYPFSACIIALTSHQEDE